MLYEVITCTCQNCGNEAEMIVTCSLEPVEEAPLAQVAPGSETQSNKNQVPGQATCTHCGNEAEIRITSYNVCYTKLLRAELKNTTSRSGFKTPSKAQWLRCPANSGFASDFIV